MNRRTLWAIGAALAVLVALTGCDPTDPHGDKAKAQASHDAVVNGSAAQALISQGYLAKQVLKRDDQHYEFHSGTTACPTSGPCPAYLVYTDMTGSKVQIVATGGQYECDIPTPPSGKTNLQDYAKLTDELKQQILQAPWHSQDPTNPNRPNVQVDGQLITCHQGVLTP